MEEYMSLPVRIAKAGLHWYLESGTRPTKDSPPIASILAAVEQGSDDMEQELLAYVRSHAAGVFVSYHLRSNDDLRGCIGTISTTAENVLAEICRNTVSAGTEDPRFAPIELDEFPDLICSVDILGAAEPIESAEELDVKRYGVIVSKGWRRGLLLPNLDGVDTVEYQIAVALSKAGIRQSEKYEMERFEVVRYE